MMLKPASRMSMLLLVAAMVLTSSSGPAGAEPGNRDDAWLAAPERSAASWRATRGQLIKRNWGVDIIGVKPSAAGYMLTFRYRILDPDKARLLNDRKAKAYLIDEATGITLAVPAMENIGELRQGARPEVARNYFMVFGNPGKIVKSGSRVTVVAGNFRAEGLIVD